MSSSQRTRTTVFSATSYDKQYLQAADPAGDIDWRFLEARLDSETASLARGSKSVVIFVNDDGSRPALEALRDVGVQHVALRCTGFNNVDLDAAQEFGLKVTRVPTYSPYAVAEHALALLMTLNRKTHRAFNRVREGNFNLNGLLGFDIHGKTVGIIGTGRIGRITAGIFAGFGARLLCFDPFPDEGWAAGIGARYARLPDFLPECDVVSLHCPLTPDTQHIINAETIALMKRGAILINTSRGRLVETKAVIRALKSGHLGGVGLDVYEEEEGVFFRDLSAEPLQDDVLARLLSFTNVIVTSHQAYFTREAIDEICGVTVKNVVQNHRGGALLPGTTLPVAR